MSNPYWDIDIYLIGNYDNSYHYFQNIFFDRKIDHPKETDTLSCFFSKKKYKNKDFRVYQHNLPTKFVITGARTYAHHVAIIIYENDEQLEERMEQWIKHEIFCSKSCDTQIYAVKLSQLTNLEELEIEIREKIDRILNQVLLRKSIYEINEHYEEVIKENKKRKRRLLGII